MGRPNSSCHQPYVNDDFFNRNLAYRCSNKRGTAVDDKSNYVANAIANWPTQAGSQWGSLFSSVSISHQQHSAVSDAPLKKCHLIYCTRALTNWLALRVPSSAPLYRQANMKLWSVQSLGERLSPLLLRLLITVSVCVCVCCVFCVTHLLLFPHWA